MFRSFNKSIDELIIFSKNNPWKPAHSSALLKRFLTDLISNQDLIFDLHDDKGRVAVAVLLDKVNNPANDACLEILGMSSVANQSQVVMKLIDLVKSSPVENRSGFQIGFHQDFIFSEESGLTHYYDTYEMLHSKVTNCDHSPPEIVKATIDDQDAVYQVLCESFAQTPDTSIPDSESWKKNFLKSPKSHFYLWKSHHKVLGFANLIEGEDRESEIRTIGVLPTARGQGIGQHLLKYCLGESSSSGNKSCRLTVAVKNEKALSMYINAGFEKVESFKCFRMNF